MTGGWPASKRPTKRSAASEIITAVVSAVNHDAALLARARKWLGQPASGPDVAGLADRLAAMEVDRDTWLARSRWVEAELEAKLTSYAELRRRAANVVEDLGGKHAAAGTPLAELAVWLAAKT